MRIVAISDLHGYLPEVPPCDVLVIAGDLCPDNPQTLRVRNGCGLLQYQWVRDVFNPWLKTQPVRLGTVATWGNHDFVGELPKHTWGLDGVHLLFNSEVVIEGVKFYGTPYVTTLPQWALVVSEATFSGHMRGVKDVDVLVTHTPPRGILDECPGYGSVGSTALARLYDTAQIQPQVHIFGHIHEGRGQVTDGTTRFCNVSLVDERYRPYKLPLTVTDV